MLHENGRVRFLDGSMEPQPGQEKGRPGVVVEVPGYGSLSEADRKKVDDLMRQRAAERKNRRG